MSRRAAPRPDRRAASTVESAGTTPGGDLLRVRPPGGPTVDVELERCVRGRLRDAYPVGRHDLEIRVGSTDAAVVEATLAALHDDLLAAEPDCRRIVFAAPLGSPDLGDAARAAGMRHVVDVEVRGGELALFVREPDWVTEVDMDLDTVPGS